MKVIKYVFQYNDGTFYDYRGEAASYAVIHKIKGINNAQFYDEPKSEYMPRYEGGKWLEVEVSYSSKEYEWPEEPAQYKCKVCDEKFLLKDFDEDIEKFEDNITGEVECPSCYCTEIEEFKEEKVR